ncbi:MAG: class I SAM-dependent methyltransferase [Gaiellaceae bacterium]
MQGRRPRSARARRHRRDWDELAEVDPLWAVISDPTRRGGRWDLEEFLATGNAEVERVLRVSRELGRPQEWSRALDFGCGVGRVTRALAAHFGEIVGVDVSAQMIEHARRVNADISNCRFEVNEAPDLGAFASGSFDFVYSRIVLQHLPRREDALRYVGEFLRVARPGGLVCFQLPGAIPLLRQRLDLRRRAYAVLRASGMSAQRLHERGLSPMRVIGIPREEVEQFLVRRGATVAFVEPDDAIADVASFQYYVMPSQ